MRLTFITFKDFYICILQYLYSSAFSGDRYIGSITHEEKIYETSFCLDLDDKLKATLCHISVTYTSCLLVDFVSYKIFFVKDKLYFKIYFRNILCLSLLYVIRKYVPRILFVEYDFMNDVQFFSPKSFLPKMTFTYFLSSNILD